MKREETKSVVLVGVGGQGTILAGKVFTTGLIAAGYDVKMSEVHGMSQRGGSVSTQVRYGSKVYSPVIGRGEADVLVAFETMEAARYLSMLKPEGKIVVNDYQIPSLPVLCGEREYPDEIIQELRSKASTVALDAARIAAGEGNPRGMNMVLLGALIRSLGIDHVDWASALREHVKRPLVDANLRCLDAGMNAAEETA